MIDKIRFKDLSGWLKFAAIASWTLTGLVAISWILQFVAVIAMT